MADEIESGLWLGDYHDGASFDGERLCVRELPPEYGGQTPWYHIRISYPTRTGDRIAYRAQLDACAAVINHRLINGARLIVHCDMGLERSPLTVAYWLVKSGKCPTFETAYTAVRAKRPTILDRRNWVEPGPPL